MTLWKYWKVDRIALVWTLLFQLGFFLIGCAMVLFINRFLNDEMDYACMGTLFSLIGACVGTVAKGNLTGNTRFALAVSMGQTRKSYLLCSSLMTAFNTACALVLVRLLWVLERGAYAALYPGYSEEILLGPVFWSLPVMVCIVVGIVVFELGLSAMLQKVGIKGFFPLWLVCMLFGIVFPRAAEAWQEGSTSLLARLGGGVLWLVESVPGWLWIGIAVAFVLAIPVAAVMIFRKAEVRL